MNSINLIYFDAVRASACMSVAVLAATLNAFIARLCDGVRSYYNCESWIIRFRETNSLQFLSHQLGFASSAYASPLFASPSGNDGAKALAEDREKQELRSKIRALEALVRQPPPMGGGLASTTHNTPKRTRDADTRPACHDFQGPGCARTVCKYNHVCVRCGSSDHGASKCSS